MPALRDARLSVPGWLKEVVPASVKSRIQQALEPEPSDDNDPPEGEL